MNSLMLPLGFTTLYHRFRRIWSSVLERRRLKMTINLTNALSSLRLTLLLSSSRGQLPPLSLVSPIDIINSWSRQAQSWIRLWRARWPRPKEWMLTSVRCRVPRKLQLVLLSSLRKKFQASLCSAVLIWKRQSMTRMFHHQTSVIKCLSRATSQIKRSPLNRAGPVPQSSKSRSKTHQQPSKGLNPLVKNPRTHL